MSPAGFAVSCLLRLPRRILAARQLALWAPWLLCLATACAPTTSLTYLVALSPGNPSQLAVTLHLEGAPPDSLAFRGYASREVLRITDLEAVGPGGAVIRAVAETDTATIEDQRVEIPRILLRGPLPSSLTVRYRVTPGKREGDSHMGFTGRCFGYAGEAFAMVTGRELFLLPERGADAIHQIEVRFSLPHGWEAVAPWARQRDRWLPGVQGSYAPEHLISAAIGLGRFRERSFQAGATRFRLAFESRTTREQEEQAAARLTRVARYIRDLFGRDLGPSYLTIVVPEAPTGDEIAGEGWATGQGQTLAPLTGNRLHDFAAHLIEAYTRHAPYRTEIRSPEEYWLVDGITNLYAWRAVVASGLISEEDLDRALAANYVAAFTAEGIERDLERLYETPQSARFGRENLAPFVLLHFDHALRYADPAAGGLDAVVRRMFHGKTAPSFWSSLPAGPSDRWREFRAFYVRGTTLASVTPYFAMARTRPLPEPRRGRPTRELTLAYTGNSFGFLENCGCKINQSGGVARRSTMLRELRRKDPNLLLLDVGNAFIKPEKQDKPDFFSMREQGLYLRIMDLMRYGAAAIGTTEITFGLDHFRKMTRGMHTPYLAANILADGRPIAPASVMLHAGAVRVAVIGLFEPPRGEAAEPLFEAHTSQLTIEDPIETLRRALPTLRRQADLVIAMGRIEPATIRRLVEACPGLDVVLSVDDNAPTLQEKGGVAELSKEDPPGFIGSTLVLYTPLQNYGFSSARLGLDAEGRVASADIANHWLTHDVRDDPAVRAQLDRFYDEVGKLDAAQASVKPLFESDPIRLQGRYVGADRCLGCHRQEYTQWKTTRHAGAYKTLLDAHRHYQPRCISCHVVGYGTPHGYKVGMPEEPLGNVQCEVCHGPGAEHVESPAQSNIRRLVPEKVCLECHNPDHSDHFVYAEKVPKVRHDYFEGGEAAAGPSSAK